MSNTRQTPFYYGWIIVAVATLALVVSNGLAINGIPAFYKSVQNHLVAAGSVNTANVQSVYGVAPALTFLTAGALALVAGFLINRFSLKALMIAGCGILGAAMAVYSQASTPVLVYAAHTLLGTSLGFVGVLACTVLVSRWFDKRRGTALGIVLTGTSLGGVLIPLISTPLIARFGWQSAMLIVSLLVWMVLLPAVIFLVKEQPADIGLEADGESSVTDDQPLTTETDGVGFAEALKMPIFWIFGLVAALVFYVIFVVSQQLNLYLQSPRVGFTQAEAARVQSLLFALSVAGKFAYGFLSDRFPVARVMLVSAVTLFISTLAFIDLNGTSVYFFAIFFGLNYGGTFVLLQLMVAKYFGTRDYGKILGAVTVIETVGAMSGTFITGRIADLDGGDYARAFYGVILVSALSLVAVVALNFVYSRPEPDAANSRL
jgi:sugar phosphate permease